MMKRSFNFNRLAAQISSVIQTKSMALRNAVKVSDINTVRELLEQRANPNFVPIGTKKSLLELACSRDDPEIIKLILQRRISRRFIYKVYKSMLNDSYHGPIGQIELLELLLDNALPVTTKECDTDECYFDMRGGLFLDKPLSIAFSYERIDFVILLLQRGADPNKQDPIGYGGFFRIAGMKTDKLILKKLMKKGVNINEISDSLWVGCNALYAAFYYGCAPDGLALFSSLLENNKDDRVLDIKRVRTILSLFVCDDEWSKCNKEIAKLHYKNYLTKKKDGKIMEYLLENGIFGAIEYMEELLKMDNLKVYDGLSLYDMLETRKGVGDKFIRLSTKANFISAFKSCFDVEQYRNYSIDLYRSLEIAQERGKILQQEEEKLYLIFKNHLPDLVIQQIAYYSAIDLLYDT